MLVACLSFCFVHFNTCIFTMVEHVGIILELTKIYLAFNVYYVGKGKTQQMRKVWKKGERWENHNEAKDTEGRKTRIYLSFVDILPTMLWLCRFFSLEILTLGGPRGPSWAWRFHRNGFKITSWCFRLKVSKLTSS